MPPVEFEPASSTWTAVATSVEESVELYPAAVAARPTTATKQPAAPSLILAHVLWGATARNKPTTSTPTQLFTSHDIWLSQGR